MRMFVKKSDTIIVTIFVWQIGDSVGASTEKSEAPKESKPEEVHFTFKRPSYDDSRQLMKVAKLSGNQESLQFQIDPIQLQDQILRILLRDWDIKDESGRKVECTQRNVNELEPVIARSAVSGVMEKIEL